MLVKKRVHNCSLQFEIELFSSIQNLMDASLLTAKEVEWIDSYHTRVRDLVGPYLKAKGKAETYNWLLEETKLMA